MLIVLFLFSKLISPMIDKKEISVGEIIKYEININKGKNIKLDTVRLPKKGHILNDSSNFEVRNVKVSESRGAIKVIYEITSFKTGEDTIPALVINCKENGKPSEITTNPVPVKIKSVLPDDIQDIKDIKSPESIPINWMPIILTLLIIAILSVGGWFFYNKRKKIQQSMVPSRPPYEVALERLNALKLENNDIKKYYVELSDIIRQYIEGRYSISAPTETTFELYRELKKIKIKYEIIEFIKDFLYGCDFVKFAKYVPLQQEIDRDYKKAREILNKTKPEEIPVVETALKTRISGS